MKNKDLTEHIHKLLTLRLKSKLYYIDEIRVNKIKNQLKNDFDYRIFFVMKLESEDGIIGRINKSISVDLVRVLLSSVLNIKKDNVYVINKFLGDHRNKKLFRL